MHETFGSNPLIWVIIAIEIFFWVFLLGGLTSRYVLKMRRLSSILLICVPLLDVVLVSLTIGDLARGSAPNFSHVLAVLYLGFTIGFGHNTIQRADRWFAVRFAGAERLEKATEGPEYVREQWRDCGRMMVMWLICVPLLLVMKTLTVGWNGTELAPEAVLNINGGDTESLFSTARILTVILIIWFVSGPVYASLFRGVSAKLET